MNQINKEAIELGKQLNLKVSSMDELADLLDEMGLILGMDSSGAWVVLNSSKEFLAKVE